MASVFRDQKTGKWKAEICIDGVRKGKRFDTKTEAVAWTENVGQQLRKGGALPPSQVKKITLHDAMMRYLEVCTSTRRLERTKQDEESRIRKLAGYDIAKKRLAAITLEDVRAWKSARLKETTARGRIRESTASRDLDTYRAIVNFAVKSMGVWLPQNYFAEIRQTMRKKTVTTPRIWTDEEKAALVAAFERCRNKDYSFALLIAAETGLRKGELTGLRWCDYLYPDPLLRVERTEDRSDAFGRIFVDGTKGSPNAPETIPLTPVAVELLNGLRDSRKPRPLPNELIFNFSYYALDSQWSRITKWAAVNFRIHDLRHVAITAAAKLLGDVYSVAGFARHSDVSTTAIYVHVAQIEIAERLARAMAKSKEME